MLLEPVSKTIPCVRKMHRSDARARPSACVVQEVHKVGTVLERGGAVELCPRSTEPDGHPRSARSPADGWRSVPFATRELSTFALAVGLNPGWTKSQTRRPASRSRFAAPALANRMESAFPTRALLRRSLSLRRVRDPPVGPVKRPLRRDLGGCASSLGFSRAGRSEPVAIGSTGRSTRRFSRCDRFDRRPRSLSQSSWHKINGLRLR